MYGWVLLRVTRPWSSVWDDIYLVESFCAATRILDQGSDKNTSCGRANKLVHSAHSSLSNFECRKNEEGVMTTITFQDFFAFINQLPCCSLLCSMQITSFICHCWHTKIWLIAYMLSVLICSSKCTSILFQAFVYCGSVAKKSGKLAPKYHDINIHHVLLSADMQCVWHRPLVHIACGYCNVSQKIDTLLIGTIPWTLPTLGVPRFR